ncbi:hypothetical protein AB6A40_006001 [Gnathostoma spinigerum]|uniref:Uncharacterized protein n=1 Tax=Gnathostoma spinigerum TaxID=75299 RepID=A0ABD6ERI3_9BILA
MHRLSSKKDRKYGLYKTVQMKEVLGVSLKKGQKYFGQHKQMISGSTASKLLPKTERDERLVKTYSLISVAIESHFCYLGEFCDYH